MSGKRRRTPLHKYFNVKHPTAFGGISTVGPLGSKKESET